jgi:hypothetical protein
MKKNKVYITIFVLLVVIFISFIGINKTVVDKTIGLGIVGINPGSVSYIQLLVPGKINIDIESEEPIIFYLTDPSWCQIKTRDSQDRADKYYAYKNGIIKETFSAEVDTIQPCMIIYGQEEGIRVNIKMTERINLFSFIR